ncbi:ArsC family reductase [Vibrio spartinae]|uniref:Modulator of the general stress response n=1 Tax=Vibrio spartinae TaxID=1918945 RepID=A0ABX6R1F6_9VIBR|nr:ArsC family reductase [Vibrio spartinae]QMV15131.1 Modulator of the general stress response [Vibrio spartinae]
MTITLYGIPNCDTIKKARRWLDAENIDYRFHDFRKDGIHAELIEEFCHNLGWDKVVNKRGTTYRQLTQAQKDSLNSTTAIPLLVESPAMIKRPVLVVGNTFHLGFSPEQYSEIFA